MKQISDFASRLQEYREVENLSFKDFSDKVDVPAPTLNRYVLRKRFPKMDTVKDIAKKLNVNPMWLMGYDVEMEQKENLPLSERERQADELLTQLLGELSLEELQRVADFVAGLKAQR